jgi:hypothetical protein
MSFYNCKNCNNRKNLQMDFWISSIDTLGFIFVSFLLTAPILFLTNIWESLDYTAEYIVALIAFIISSYKKEYLISILLLSVVLVFPIDILDYIVGLVFPNINLQLNSVFAGAAFFITFCRIGKKVYGFFFLCVNYRLSFNVTCEPCNLVYKSINLPSKDGSKPGI